MFSLLHLNGCIQRRIQYFFISVLSPFLKKWFYILSFSIFRILVMGNILINNICNIQSIISSPHFNKLSGNSIWNSLREKCPHSEFFWSVFSRIWIEYGEIRSISPYSVRMRENMDQEKSEYGHFLRSVFA